MTVYTLQRNETEHQPAARCTFEQQVSESGRKWVDVTMKFFYPAHGWVSTMGKGDGPMNVRHAREYYARLLETGYTAA